MWVGVNFGARMTVLKRLRNESSMSVILRARELAVYTMQVCGNEKRFPKRYRWCITAKVVEEAKEILRKLTFANSMRVDVPEEGQQRRMMQAKAMAHSFCLLTEINIAFDFLGLPEREVRHWTGLVMEVQRLLKAWQKSDAARQGAKH